MIIIRNTKYDVSYTITSDIQGEMSIVGNNILVKRIQVLIQAILSLDLISS